MQLASYIPEFVANTKEIDALFQALQQEIEFLNLEIEKILQEMFVLGSSEYATNKYENIVGIIPKLSESLKKRQLDILAIYNEALPFTFQRLILMLNAILGKDNFLVELDIVSFRLKLTIDKNNLRYEETIISMLERVVPLNIMFEFKIDWNTWKDLKDFTWSYVKKYTWKEAKESEELDNGR